jgi:endonuclease YncB( thermonuclease family)
MARSTLVWAVVALVVPTTGCTMCAHPYDYCAPTFTGEGCQQCVPNVREGSILTAGVPLPLAPETGPEIVPVPDAETVRVLDGDNSVVAKTPERPTVVRYATKDAGETAAPLRPERVAPGPAGRLR